MGRSFFQIKMNIKMFPLDVKDQNIGLLIKSLKKDNVYASAVTLPYKEKVIKYLDEVDQAASEVGSVNLIIKSKNKLKGYITEAWMFITLKIYKRIKKY